MPAGGRIGESVPFTVSGPILTIARSAQRSITPYRWTKHCTRYIFFTIHLFLCSGMPSSTSWSPLWHAKLTVRLRLILSFHLVRDQFQRPVSETTYAVIGRVWSWLCVTCLDGHTVLLQVLLLPQPGPAEPGRTLRAGLSRCRRHCVLRPKRPVWRRNCVPKEWAPPPHVATKHHSSTPRHINSLVLETH